MDATGSGGVNADAARSEAGRASGRGPGEDILFAHHGSGHEESIKAASYSRGGRRRLRSGQAREGARPHTVLLSSL